MTKARKQIKNGSFLGACKIVRLLGRGSMGETYEAQDVLLDRHTVVKVVSPFITELAEASKRFSATGQALARINHQNIATVYALKEIDGVNFIVMEFVEGLSLKDIVRTETAVDPDRAVKIFRQVLEGVKCMHDAGVLHQDLKPKNIIVRPDNFVKVVDFGIGRIDGQEVVSTIYYLAPEVIDGRPGSIQSDIWSLGVSLFESLTGEKPFQSEDWSVVVEKISKESLVFPTRRGLAVPEALQNIIRKMCAKNPKDRYESTGEVLQELRALESLGSVAIPPVLELETKATNPKHESTLSIATFTGKSIQNSTVGRGTTTAGLFALAAIAFFVFKNVPTPSRQPSSVGAVVTEGVASSTNSPAEGEQVHLSEGEVLKFTWNKPPRGGVYLEVARDREFRELLFREAFRSSPYAPTKPLKEGKYYWRLVDQSANANRGLTNVTSFSVVSDGAPKPMYPAANYLPTDAKPVQFFWLNKFGVDTYRFQIASEKSFEHLVTDVVVDGIQTEPITLPAGKFFWRVRAEDRHSVTSLWSEIRTVQMPGTALASVSPPPPPLPVAPAVAPAPAAAQAQPPAPAPKPTVTPTITHKAAAKKSSKPAVVAKADPKPLKTKKAVAHRVAKKSQALDIVPAPVAKRRIAATAPAEALVPGPRLKLPPNGVSIVSLNGAVDPVLFRWESRGEQAVYRLQLSTDEAFRALLLNVLVRENQFIVTKKLPQGRIFWRVRSDDGVKSQWSSTSTIEFSK